MLIAFVRDRGLQLTGFVMSISTYDSLFKEVPEGFLFRAPNNWLFWKGEHYLVDRTQRAEILELGRVRHPIVQALVLVFILVGCPAGSTLIVYVLSGHVEPNGRDLLAIAILALASLAASAFVAGHLRFRRLHAIVASLPRSHQKLTLKEMQANQTNSMSMKSLLVTGAIFAGSAILQGLVIAFNIGYDLAAQGHLSFDKKSLLPFVLMLVFGSVCALYVARAISRLRG